MQSPVELHSQPNVSTLQSGVFIWGDLSQRGFTTEASVYAHGMTSSANRMGYGMFLWQIGTVCPSSLFKACDTSVKGYGVVPYIQGVTEPIKRIVSNCNIKVASKPYLT